MGGIGVSDRYRQTSEQGNSWTLGDSSINSTYTFALTIVIIPHIRFGLRIFKHRGWKQSRHYPLPRKWPTWRGSSGKSYIYFTQIWASVKREEEKGMWGDPIYNSISLDMSPDRAGGWKNDTCIPWLFMGHGWRQWLSHPSSILFLITTQSVPPSSLQVALILSTFRTKPWLAFEDDRVFTCTFAVDSHHSHAIMDPFLTSCRGVTLIPNSFTTAYIANLWSWQFTYIFIYIYLLIILVTATIP